jgi:circadian clock protein KaiB
MSAADQRALASLRQICEEHLPGAHELEVVDLHECPHRAIEDNIFALPTLVRLEPLPVRKLVGDLNEVRDLLATLDLVPTPPESDGEGSAR